MARKTATSSSPAPEEGAAAEKPARRGKTPPAPSPESGRASAEPTTAGGKSPSARKAPARKAPGAGVAAADTPAVGETGAAAPEPTTAGGKGRRAAPGTGVAESASAPAAKRTSGKAGGSAAATAGASSTAKAKGSSAPRAAGKSGGSVAEKAEGTTAARKPASSAKGRGGKRETFEETATRRRDERARDQLAEDLRAFAQARPSGWNHDDWVGFLTELAAKGHDCSDPEQIGARLERERLALSLEAIQGLEHSGVEALANRFQTLWSARHASPEDIAQTAGIPQPQAERVLHALREL